MQRLLRSMPLAAAGFLGIGAIQAEAARPNIVVVLSDDQGWGDIASHGNPDIDTPNLDRLAQDGACFNHFYVSPVCSPTRAEFLTGRYHTRLGVWSTSQGGERFNANETTLAQVFRSAGYQTAAFGKWHSGTQAPYHPNARGFDEFYGFCSGHWGDYFSPLLEHNGQIVRGQGYLPDDLTDKAMEFITAQKEKPFLVYLAYNTPHSPMQVPDRWWGKYRNRTLTLPGPPTGNPKAPTPDAEMNHARAALAMCENIDWNVGRLLGKLEELELARNTIVVYFSDNGPNGHRWNGGLRGIKGSTDEGGVRSPLLMRWPAGIAPQTRIQTISAAIDLLPTLADLAGVPVSGTQPLDGISLKSLLDGEADPPPDRMVFSHWREKVSVRTQRYRLDSEGRLYDMTVDPGQTTDLSPANPGMAARLRQAAALWSATMLQDYGRDDRPFTLAHPGFPSTQLPARDGTPHGNIRRSNRFPNCSFFTHWTRPTDAITWNCELARGGTFQVDLYYTCPAADIGSTVELTFPGSRLTGRVTQAHNPPLRGMEHDRIRRAESYVKDFKPMTLGRIRLAPGTGPLRLRAIDIPGTQVMDLRLMVLTRVD